VTTSELERAASRSVAATAAAQQLVMFFSRLRSRLRAVPSGGLTPSQASVMLRLGRDGASSTTVLAMAEGVRSQSMTATLNALAEQGLIERHPDPDDGRKHIVALSPRGLERFGDDRQGRHAWLAAAMEEKFTADQLRTIAEALTLLDELVER
jgi:DNA-binding MarR family transcriptional regulator